MRIAGILAIAAIAVLFAPVTFAQVCTTTCSLYEQGNCVEYLHTCKTLPPPPESYGAIAYSRSARAWGFSNDWGSRAKAEAVAMRNCAQRAGDCETMVWFRNQCGAVAAGDGTAAFWGLGDGAGRASASAQNKCVNGGGRNCVVLVTKCSR